MVVFKAVEEEIEIDGEKKLQYVCREGINGTGVRFRFTCGFCREKGKPMAAFRSRRQRNAHASRCLK